MNSMSKSFQNGYQIGKETHPKLVIVKNSMFCAKLLNNF